MNDPGQWLIDLGSAGGGATVDGLILVTGYARDGRSPEEVFMMEKAEAYGAHSVFFEAGRNGRPPVAQAFVFVSDGPADDQQFAELHKRLWSWGGVPLVYRTTPGLVQLFRCAHKPDFVSATGDIVCRPIKTLKFAAAIAHSEAWWDSSQLRNGTLWDDPVVCKAMLSAGKAAHKGLIDAVRQLNTELDKEGILKKHLRRRMLILSLLIAYLEERGVFPPDYFEQFLRGATKFFQVLANGKALVALLDALEERFNGHVFVLDDSDRESLKYNNQLVRFAKLIEAHEEPGGQLTLWQLYSFKDLPVELISHIYQIFVKDSDSSVYTPPFLVRLMLEEALSWERLDRLHEQDEVILDPACGSGVFLVEAYKRLVMHWRSRNQWKRPRIPDLKRLLKKVHGIDLEAGAVELAAFSLCLALCDALEPEEIRASIKLFPQLAGKTLHQSCFFDAKEQRLLKEPVGVIVGNPPFASNLSTPGAERSYQRYEEAHGSLPDKQLAYLAYKNKVVGICAKEQDLAALTTLNRYVASHRNVFRAYVAAISVRLFTQKATTLSEIDILSLPYPESGDLDLSPNEKILVDDIVKYHRDLVRLGEDSEAMIQDGKSALANFNSVFIGQINTIYKKKPLQALEAQTWPGVICQPFVFGKGSADWSGADELKGKLDTLLHKQHGTTLYVTRIARIYDGSFVFLLKPDRLRYWLRSLALRDADETLADLRTQGF